MFPVDGRTQSSDWKLILTGDTGECRNLGESDDAGKPGRGFTFSPQSQRSAGDWRAGTGFRRGLLGEVGADGGEATAAIAGGQVNGVSRGRG
jgi:hypothetical protein